MSVARLSFQHPHLVAAFKDHWGWLLGTGVAFVLLGTIGLAAAVLLTIVSIMIFAILLVAGSGLQFEEAYRARNWGARWPHLLLAGLYAAAGIIMPVDPVDASVALTLILSVLFLAAGAMRVVFALQIKPARGWRAGLLTGFGSVLMGAVILVVWPEAAVWVIGLLIAIELIINGCLCILLALAARRA